MIWFQTPEEGHGTLSERHYLTYWLGPFLVVKRHNAVNYWIRDMHFDARVKSAVAIIDHCIACRSTECKGACVASLGLHPFLTGRSGVSPS